MSPRTRTLARALDGPNAIGFLRWAFALIVIYEHSIVLGGFDDEQLDPVGRWAHGHDSIGGFAVAGFFVLSGMLITRSWLRSSSTGRYLWRRAARIYPGYWVALLVTVTVFAPIAWWHEHGGLGGYLTASPSPLGYLAHNVTVVVRQTGIGGLLGSTPYADAGGSGVWNGSLWTLAYEVTLYVLVALLGLAGLRRRAWTMPAVAGACYLALLGETVDPGLLVHEVGPLNLHYLLGLGFLFALAGALVLHADRVRIDDRLGVASILVVAAAVPTRLFELVGYPALVYAFAWLAARVPVRDWERRVGDLSYGTYIYAFPLQMLLAEFAVQRHGFLAFLAAGLVLSTLAALASWHLVEKRALARAATPPAAPSVLWARLRDTRTARRTLTS